MTPRRRHVIWDWNGTLLDDTDAAIAALNVMLRRRGLAEITRDWYRRNFAFPARPFYAKIGMAVADDEWDALAAEYYAAYAAEPARLNAGAMRALELVRAAGARQSILSALRQDLLDETVAGYGLTAYMTCVYGTSNIDGASKLDRALELMTEITADEAVMVGDSLHDQEVAAALGIPCVLCAQGSHARERLAAVAPTADTLEEAVGLALGALPVL